MTIFDRNFSILYQRYPALAERVFALPSLDNLVAFKAQDGGIAYALQNETGIQHLSDPVTPLTRIGSQLEANSAKLNDFTIPVMIIGTYPGDELLYVFDLCENVQAPHAQQKIYVCVDSLPCFCAFLQTMDAQRVLISERVKFFWHEEVENLALEFNAKPELSYLFTLISGSLNGTANRVMTPFIKLVQDRSAETERLMAENEAYYKAISDSELAAVIGQTSIGNQKSAMPSRPPRLMTLTSSWSTVTQYSTRDLCEALQSAGWDIRWINADETPTAHYIVKQINEFKPDVFLFINHLRTETPTLYPDNMMFITWVQDTVPQINSRETASKWNKSASASSRNARKRDLIIGYVSQLEKYGYLTDRLVKLPMIVNPNIFKPRVLTNEQKAIYGCDIMFASNGSMPTDQIVREILVPEFASLGKESCRQPSCLFTEHLLMRIHDHLWKQYRAGRTFTSYQALEKELIGCESSDFASACDSLSDDDHDRVIQTLFWRLNDVIYRHVILEWLDELASRGTETSSQQSASGNRQSAITIHLYGKGWEHHPRFARYARGEIQHGEELSIAYQAAHFCLHLNSLEDQHQRMTEIIASEARLLTRSTFQLPANEPPIELMKKLARHLQSGGAEPLDIPVGSRDMQIITEWLFDTAVRETQSVSAQNKIENRHPEISPSSIADTITNSILSRNDWLIPEWNKSIFATKAELAAKLGVEQKR